MMLCLWSTAGLAQYWATAEYCRAAVTSPQPDHFAPEGADYWYDAGRAIPNGTGRFWKIEAPDKPPSYLFGTMHVSDPKILRWPAPVADAFATATSVHTEIDFRHHTRASVEGRDTWDYMMRPPRVDLQASIFDIIEGGPYPRIKGWVATRTETLGYGPDASTYLSVAGLGYVLLASPCGDFEWGGLPMLDQHIQIEAVIADKSFAALESRTQFLEDLSTKRWATSAAAIVLGYGAYLKPPPSPTSRASSVALYTEGAIGTMIAMDRAFLMEEFGPDRGNWVHHHLDEYLLVHRNRAFLDSAAPYLAQGGAFIAVGSFHLPKDTGLIAMLRQDGFTVTRVPLPGEREN